MSIGDVTTKDVFLFSSADLIILVSDALPSFCMIAAVVFYTYFVAIILRNVNLLALK
jgi:hypothetical protein